MKAQGYKSIFKIIALVGIPGMVTGCVHTKETTSQLILADHGRTTCVITLARGHSAPEQHAAEELARFLKEVTGADFAIVAPEDRGRRKVIAVGPGAAHAIAPGLSVEGLGPDGMVIQTQGPHLILTGGPGAPRGTLYAVYAFLEDPVGCRWWTAKVSVIPRCATLAVPETNIRYVPCFEYRDTDNIQTRDPDWSVRNKCNGACSKQLDAARGGRIDYLSYSNGWGFVHTFNALVPPDEFFPKHPEWFAEIDGKRVSSGA